MRSFAASSTTKWTACAPSSSRADAGRQASVANRSAPARPASITIEAIMPTPMTAATAAPPAPPATPPARRAQLALPVIAALMAYLLACVWPTRIGAAAFGSESQTVRLLWSGLAFEIAADVQLALLAGLSGGLACLAHAAVRVAHLMKRQGTHALQMIHWQLATPFIGIGVALLFHAVMRSSLLTEDVGTDRLNALGLAVHGVLAGLVSKPAIDRLGEMLGTLLHRAHSTHKALGDEGDAEHPRPVVLQVDVHAPPNARARPSIVVRGARFVPASQVYVNGRPQETVFVDDTQLHAHLKTADGPIGAGLRVRVVNPPPGGGMSPPLERR
jgi:hypothetical protein